MGGVLGVLLGIVITDVIVAIMPPFMLPAEADVRLSIPVLLFTLCGHNPDGLALWLRSGMASNKFESESNAKGRRAHWDRQQPQPFA